MDAHTNQIDMDMMAEAAEWFGRAIQREAGFASAYFLRSDYHAHLTTSGGVTDAERQVAYAAYMKDLASASEFTPSADERALIEVDRTLASDNWRSLPERFETALESRSCAEAVWLEVAPAFGFAEQSLAYRRRMIECDPLNFYNYHAAVQAALWAGLPDEAFTLASRGAELDPDNPFIEWDLVVSLMALGRHEEARDHAAGVSTWNRATLMAVTSNALGDTVEATRYVSSALDDAAPWLKRYLTIQLNAVTGNRDAANEAAAWLDAIPAGQTMLAATTMECMCGAPFDLEATPVFAKRLEEAGFTWPPKTIINLPATVQ
jgi:tetratricopeptide (TPR) repeat protein